MNKYRTVVKLRNNPELTNAGIQFEDVGFGRPNSGRKLWVIIQQ